MGIVEARQRSRTKQTTMLSYSVSRVNGRIRYKYRYIYTKRVWQPVTNLLEGLHADFLPRSSSIYGALVSIQFFAPSLSLSIWITILSAIKSGMRKRETKIIEEFIWSKNFFNASLCCKNIYVRIRDNII